MIRVDHFGLELCTALEKFSLESHFHLLEKMLLNVAFSAKFVSEVV